MILFASKLGPIFISIQKRVQSKDLFKIWDANCLLIVAHDKTLWFESSTGVLKNILSLTHSQYKILNLFCLCGIHSANFQYKIYFYHKEARVIISGSPLSQYDNALDISCYIFLHTVKWENLAEINFHWLAHPNVFAHVIFTTQWQFFSISLLKRLLILIFTALPHQ